MKKFTLDFKLNTMPPVFLRGESCLIVCKNADGKFIMGSKKMYPDGIVRFVGGGLEESSPEIGAARELEEELGVKISPGALRLLARITCNITHKEPIVYVVHLFFAKIDSDFVASSDLDEVVLLDKNQMTELIEKYESLTDKTPPDLGFSWRDYGKVFAEVHRIGLQQL